MVKFSYNNFVPPYHKDISNKFEKKMVMLFLTSKKESLKKIKKKLFQLSKKKSKKKIFEKNFLIMLISLLIYQILMILG